MTLPVAVRSLGIAMSGALLAVASGMSVQQMFIAILMVDLAQFPIIMQNRARSASNGAILDERGGKENG